MHVFRNIYEFASSAGALEGYVYHRDEVNMEALVIWVDNLVAAYGFLPPEVLEQIQSSVDQTLGRAVKSIMTITGEDHDVVGKLKSMVTDRLPESPDDFQKKKWFQG